ncbi:Replication factor C subunit 5 [Histomonas meleagridis]|uniref:Replication factor C subunit 5 n=1 Tax=Histomonas meleagridis TaxID=135588 RepID=UPI00355A0AC7|nr:Replication factor C subunit 5 [Histomonas meleagridis]KAH0804848.1 Replication factor C subunit 5 [Histomonas meleagridis]
MSEARTDTLPWVEKYRPTTFDQIISHEAARSTIDKLIEQNCLPHLLFYGPPGTGKTTMAHAIALKLFGNTYKSMVLELNASDERGIDVVREQIKRFASTRMIFGTGHKLIILDESDAMTSTAQAALRRIMEKYSSNVRFIMICNYPEKLIPALRSRCTEFRFPPLPNDSAAEYLINICKSENVEFTEDGISALLTLGNGDLRRSINLLQTTALATSTITEANVYLCAGYPLPEEIKAQLQNLMNQSLEASVQSLEQLRCERGLALLDIVRELHRQTVLLEMNSNALANILDNLAQIERRIAEGCSERIQTVAIAAAYQMLRMDLDHQ